MIDVHFAPEAWNESEWQAAARGLGAWKHNPGAGFLVAANDQSQWQAIRKRADELRRRARRFVVVGVGGSSLGAQTLTKIVAASNVYYLENLDPESISELKTTLGDLSEVHWIWTSKSGSTLELLAAFEVVQGWYKERKLTLKEFSSVIAAPIVGPLQDWANSQSVPLLPIPESVSGRFSVFTASGLLPAAIAGVDLKDLQLGIEKAMSAQVLAQKLVAATLASWRRGEWITVFWTYGDRMATLSHWSQQLWAESLAKTVDRDGRTPPRVSFPVVCTGSRDQHSVLQQIVEGARDKWLWMMRVAAHESLEPRIESSSLPATRHLQGRTLGQIFQAQAEGTHSALQEVGISTCEWVWPRYDAAHAAFAMFLLEMVVASLGECLNIDTYNQPGVERGKSLTSTLLHRD